MRFKGNPWLWAAKNVSLELNEITKFKISTMTNGFIKPVLKHRKDACGWTSYRSIILLSAWRELVSLIWLPSTEETIDQGIERRQHAHMEEKSATDTIVFHKILLGLNRVRKFDFTLVGTEMSKTFDTTNCVKWKNVIKDYTFTRKCSNFKDNAECEKRKEKWTKSQQGNSCTTSSWLLHQNVHVSCRPGLETRYCSILFEHWKELLLEPDLSPFAFHVAYPEEVQLFQSEHNQNVAEPIRGVKKFLEISILVKRKEDKAE